MVGRLRVTIHGVHLIGGKYLAVLVFDGASRFSAPVYAPYRWSSSPTLHQMLSLRPGHGITDDLGLWDLQGHFSLDHIAAYFAPTLIKHTQCVRHSRGNADGREIPLSEHII